MTQDVTVIIPVHNRQSLVLDAIDSIAAQTVLPRQVIIVDDGSTDNTVRTINKWLTDNHPIQKNMHCQFRLIEQPKQNAAAARRHGMHIASPTKFIAFLDSDDIWPTNFIERTLAALHRVPDSIAASTDRQYIDEHRNLFKFDNCTELARSPLKWLFRHDAGVASCSVFSWDAITAAGGWDQAYEIAEDAVLFSKITTLGKWAHAPGPPVTFRHNKSGLGSDEGNLSRKHVDRFLQWALTHEKIYYLLASQADNAELHCMRLHIGRYWYRGGKQLETDGISTKAADCFRKALQWAPSLVRPRIRLLRMRQPQGWAS